MDNNKVNVVNGMVTGVFLGTPMQDATPDTPTDNKPYATERNTESRLSNYDAALEYQPEKSGGSTGGGALVVNFHYTSARAGHYSAVHTFDGITLDKTYDEIKAAVDAGIPVEIRMDSSADAVMHLFSTTYGYYHFSCVYASYDPLGTSYKGTATMYCLCIRPEGPVGGYFTIK